MMGTSMNLIRFHVSVISFGESFPIAISFFAKEISVGNFVCSSSIFCIAAFIFLPGSVISNGAGPFCFLSLYLSIPGLSLSFSGSQVSKLAR